MALFNFFALVLIIGGTLMWFHYRKVRFVTESKPTSVSDSCHGLNHSGCVKNPCTCGCHVESIPPRIRL